MGGQNKLLKEHLIDGIPIQYRAGGDSLYPIVHHGDQCLFYPVCHPETLAVGDIVFCEVGLHPRYYRFCVRMIMHVKVVERYWNYNTHKYEERRYFRIGTTHAGVDGHAWAYMVHGKLVEVVGTRNLP